MRPACPLRRPPSGTLLGRLSCTTLLGLTCLSAAVAQASPDRIPDLHGTTLSGQTVDLPSALESKVGILVVGFSRESRARATVWGKRLAADFGQSSNVLYFELPVVEDVPRLLRGAVLHAIGRNVAPAAQAHFLPIASNQTQWKSVTHFNEPDAAYVLVVDGSGIVRWQTSSDPTDGSYASLRQAVSNALARPASAPSPKSPMLP